MWCACCHRVADPCQQFDTLLDAEPMLFGMTIDAKPVDELHGIEGTPTSTGDVGARFVNLSDAWMTKPSEKTRLTPKPALSLATGELRSDDLNGDAPKGLLLLGLVDDAHPAPTDLTHNPIPADLLRDLLNLDLRQTRGQDRHSFAGRYLRGLVIRQQHALDDVSKLRIRTTFLKRRRPRRLLQITDLIEDHERSATQFPAH